MHDDYVFSEKLRKALAQFGKMSAQDAIRDPRFLSALMDHCAISKEKQNEIWIEIGREDLVQGDK